MMIKLNIMKFCVVLFLCFLFVSCTKKEKNDVSKSDSMMVVDSTMAEHDLEMVILEQAPGWYKSMPEKEGYIYTVGTAKSRRGSIATNKAVMKARIKMADKLKEMEYDINSDLDKIPQGADMNPSDDNLSMALQNVIIKEKKQIKTGDYWHTFVLLEMQLKKL